MKLNVDETTPAASEAAENQTPEAQTPEVESAPAEKPVRRRVSRRATAAAGAPTETPAAAAPAEPAAEVPAPETSEVAEPAAEAPKKRVTRTRKKVAETPEEAVAPGVEAPAEPAAAAAAPAAVEASATAEAPAAEAPKKRVTRTRKKVAETPEQAAPAEEAPDAKAAPAEAPTADAAATEPAATEAPTSETPASETPAPEQSASEKTAEAAPARGRRRTTQRTTASAQATTSDATTADSAEASTGDADPSRTTDGAADQAENASDAEKTNRRNRGRGRGQKTETAEPTEPQEAAEASSDDAGTERGDRRNGDSPRSSRTRQRDRKRRGQGDDLEPELAEDDVLLPIAGILDVLDNYAFVRTSGYLPGMSDVYVSLGQVKKYGMRRGDAVVGAIRQPREGEGGGRQKYNAIVKVDSVNGRAIEENEKRADIAEMTPLYPQERLRLAEAGKIGREIDRVAPFGLGQRAVIAVPEKITSLDLLVDLVAGVSQAKPEAHVMLVATNTRPEDATRLQRTVRGEVVVASFDRPAEDQTTIAELAVDRARRLVELGHDVVLLLDSLTDLVHAYVKNQQGGRTAPEVAEAQAIGQVKKLIAAARNVENGGSLTVIATARTKTGLAVDKELLREITPALTGYVRIGGSRFAPEIDAEHTYSRGAEELLDERELAELAKQRSE